MPGPIVRLQRLCWLDSHTGFERLGLRLLLVGFVLAGLVPLAAQIDNDGDGDGVLDSEDNCPSISNPDQANADAALFGSRRIISAAGARSVHAIEVDGDGDVDAVSGFEESLVWYENLDGAGSFGSPRLIATPVFPESVFAADLDGDGDPDVVSASEEVAWYRNLDGAGNFATVERTAGDSVVKWDSVSGAIFYNVIRAELSRVIETDSTIELGAVTCIANRSLDVEAVTGADPPPGEVFLYLVESNDGWSSSYGTESAAKPRVLLEGSCGDVHVE